MPVIHTLGSESFVQCFIYVVSDRMTIYFSSMFFSESQKIVYLYNSFDTSF